jgi:NAD(P)H dehydrogenase (quinone)
MDSPSKNKFLLVLAHPNPKSYNAAIKDKTVESILNQGHEVEVSDLYRMNFGAVAGKNDFKSHMNSEEINLIE